jgi:hypothetical protein
MSTNSPENTSLVPWDEPPARDVETVPFVELFGDRVQGVVSSGSDVARVYCVFLEAGSGDYYSSTNNNRPDVGMSKRLHWLVEEAAKQFGLERVARFLRVPGDPAAVRRPADVVAVMLRTGRRKPDPAGTVFSRFLTYLRFVELASAAGPVPEMAWFVGR